LSREGGKELKKEAGKVDGSVLLSSKTFGKTTAYDNTEDRSMLPVLIVLGQNIGKWGQWYMLTAFIKVA
jgi:hypothetical protein